MATDPKRKAAEALLGALALPEGEAGWAREARARARSRLLEAGAPARRDEYWRQTDPSKLTAPLAPVRETTESPEGRDAFPGIARLRLRFVNGRFRPDLSDPLPAEGCSAQPLSQAMRQDIGLARELFGTLEEAGQEKVVRPLAMLNTACATEGLVLRVTGRIGTPIELVHDRVGDGVAMLRHLIRVETGGAVTLLESGNAANTLMEVDLASGAEFHHLRTATGERAPAAAHVFARIGAGAQFKSFALVADGELTRTETVFDLVGDNASGHVAGAVLGKGGSHIDHTVFVTHTGQHCESRQVFKNVLADKAKSVFQGKIFVRSGAQKTDGYQISQAVLLTDGAEFSAKPELEIYADDVACSHGSTTGSLDDTALFYLRSRGVPLKAAEAMLVASFVDEAIAEIADEALADAMRTEVATWMAGRG